MKPKFRAKEYSHFLYSIKGTKTILAFITNAFLIIKYFVGTCMPSKKIVLKKSVYNQKYYHLFSFWKVFIGNFCNLNEFIEHFFVELSSGKFNLLQDDTKHVKEYDKSIRIFPFTFYDYAKL